MRRGAAVLAAVLAAGLVGLVVLGLTREQERVYALGVMPAQPAVELRAGDEVCQRPVAVPEGAAFDEVVVVLGTYGRRGPALGVTVSDARSGDVLGRGRLPQGYPDVAAAPEHAIDVGRVEPSGPLAICLENLGARRVAAYGALGFTSTYTTARLDGKPLPTDLTLTLRRSEGRTLLAALPDALRHAAAFKSGVLTPVTLGLLGLIAVLAVAALLPWALLRAVRADRG
jgi:hypothetical protein